VTRTAAMRAAFIDAFGPADGIRFGPLPAPVPGPTDVLVDVSVTTVNPVDTFVRSGLFRTAAAFPFVMSRDLVGTVREVGEGAPGFKPGETVWCNSLGHGGRQGAAAEQAVVPVDRLYHLPAGLHATNAANAINTADAVAVVHPAATAYLALFTHGDLRPGQTVLVEGAGGNVGSALVVLAERAGARVVATARDADFAYVRSLGADEVIDYRDADLTDRLRTACPHGVDLRLDASGQGDLAAAVSLLAHRGRIVLLAGARARPMLPAGELYMKDGSIRGFVISHATAAELAEAARAINALLPTGRLRARRMEHLPLSAAAETHRRLEAGELHGTRAVLHVSH
jgi:NADPH:quinone reductase-like Zn-dependent oxidoreductase